MMLKTINITVGILVALSLWSAAILFTVLVAVLALHVLAIGGLTAHYLLHS